VQEATTVLTATQAELQDPITLIWTAPGDDGTTGSAARYDIRFNTQPITDELTWMLSTTLDGGPLPEAAGTIQSMVVSLDDLPIGSPVYFAIKGVDRAGNESTLSNSSYGWTIFKPSTDTRIVYVSSSTGNDSWDGLAPEWNGKNGPKKTVTAGKALIRKASSDWLLFKRGDRDDQRS